MIEVMGHTVEDDKVFVKLRSDNGLPAEAVDELMATVAGKMAEDYCVHTLRMARPIITEARPAYPLNNEEQGVEAGEAAASLQYGRVIVLVETR